MQIHTDNERLTTTNKQRSDKLDEFEKLEKEYIDVHKKFWDFLLIG